MCDSNQKGLILNSTWNWRAEKRIGWVKDSPKNLLINFLPEKVISNMLLIPDYMESLCQHWTEPIILAVI